MKFRFARLNKGIHWKILLKKAHEKTALTKTK